MEKTNKTLVDYKLRTTSLIVAEAFGKQHKNVMQTINGLDESARARLKIQPGSYTDGNNQSRPLYSLNRDGCMFLIMGFNGAKAQEWKLKFIEAFNRMEQRMRKHPPKPESTTIMVVDQFPDRETQMSVYRLESLTNKIKLKTEEIVQMQHRVDRWIAEKEDVAIAVEHLRRADKTRASITGIKEQSEHKAPPI